MPFAKSQNLAIFAIFHGTLNTYKKRGALHGPLSRPTSKEHYIFAFFISLSTRVLSMKVSALGKNKTYVRKYEYGEYKKYICRTFVLQCM